MTSSIHYPYLPEMELEILHAALEEWLSGYRITPPELAALDGSQHPAVVTRILLDRVVAYKEETVCPRHLGEAVPTFQILTEKSPL